MKKKRRIRIVPSLRWLVVLPMRRRRKQPSNRACMVRERLEEVESVKLPHFDGEIIGARHQQSPWKHIVPNLG